MTSVADRMSQAEKNARHDLLEWTETLAMLAREDGAGYGTGSLDASQLARARLAMESVMQAVPRLLVDLAQLRTELAAATKALGFIPCAEDGETLATAITELRAGPELVDERGFDDVSTVCRLCRRCTDEPHVFDQCIKNIESDCQQVEDFRLEEQRRELTAGVRAALGDFVEGEEATEQAARRLLVRYDESQAALGDSNLQNVRMRQYLTDLHRLSGQACAHDPRQLKEQFECTAGAIEKLRSASKDGA